MLRSSCSQTGLKSILFIRLYLRLIWTQLTLRPNGLANDWQLRFDLLNDRVAQNGHARSIASAAGAQEVGMAMGLGSMRAAIEDASLEATYQVRDVAPILYCLPIWVWCS